MITVYNPTGKPVEMHSVDAKECIARCGYTAQPTSKAKVELGKPTQESHDFQVMTKDQLEEYARKFGTELDKRKSKADLIAIVEGLS